MKVPFTRKRLVDWAGADAVRRAERMVDEGLVTRAECVPPRIDGTVCWNQRDMPTGLRLHDDGTVENLCPCYDNRERGLICAHAIALAVCLLRRAADPEREALYRAEQRRAARLQNLDPARYLRRAGPDTPGALTAQIRVRLADGWRDGFRQGGVPVFCEALFGDQTVPLDRVARHTPLRLSKADEALLFVLEDICEGAARARISLRPADFFNILSLHTGREIGCCCDTSVRVNDIPMTTRLRMDLDGDTGELILRAHTELPFVRAPEQPVHLVAGRSGWACAAGHFWPLANVLPAPYHPVYDGPVCVARPNVLRFLRHELPVLERHAVVESDVSLDLFSVDPASPAFRMEINGSPAAIAATLHARYGPIESIAGKPDPRDDFGIPDADDLLRYTVRNPPAEQQALARAAALGFTGTPGDRLQSIVDKRNVLNFLGSGLPALRRAGWQVDLHGSIRDLLESADFCTPVVRVREPPQAQTNPNWFDVSLAFECAGESLDPAEIQRAIQRGESFVQHRGQPVLLDTGAIDSVRDVFADCESRAGAAPGRFRVAGIHAPFLQSALNGLDGIDIEDTADWRLRGDRLNRRLAPDPVALDPRVAAALRPYQQDGVNWLRFLEQHGLAGILADEMGLGKTVQTLVWLALPRTLDAARGAPSLVVCPTSIVENWADESARFAPSLRVLILSGAERHAHWDSLENVDLVITSYALLRRDLEHYRTVRFAVLVLDEAQHIKNRSTQNARAAKQLRALHRVVLTGTPVENGVSDLWSIMDFLMPGYLGNHEHFRDRYERPIQRAEREAGEAQARLRRKLHPFLLRRLKRDVAAELPPKIEKLSFCTLSGDQQAVYRGLLEASRRRLSEQVARRGFARCRMDVLTTLTRLRLACCHLALLKLPGLAPREPSAKKDLFFELLDEAMDAGHRVLVFSQFVRMLGLLRADLHDRGVAHCYLDGSTRDRMQVVRRFNTDRSVPVFLISLKAGGTGLNLTGADMVVHFDPWWNPAVENQATDRAYRIGQTRTVYAHKLIARHTVEEKVLALQRRKQAVIDATIEHRDGLPPALTWDDVQDLLSD